MLPFITFTEEVKKTMRTDPSWEFLYSDQIIFPAKSVEPVEVLKMETWHILD